MASSALQLYLAAQADLGGDEVILPEKPPLLRSANGAPSSSGRSRPGAEPLPPGSAAATPAPWDDLPRDDLPAAAPSAPASLSPIFDSLHQALLSAEEKHTAAFSSWGRSAPAPAPKPAAAPLPAFGRAEEFWQYLEGSPFYRERRPAGGFLIRATGPAKAEVAVAGLEPGEEDEAGGLVFQGEAGLLLEKMLKAIGLERRDVYCTTLLKLRTGDRKAGRRELLPHLPYLEAELKLTGARFVVFLGETLAQVALKTPKRLEDLRLQPASFGAAEAIASYAPADLLLRPELKRFAWEDLKWLLKRLEDSRNRP